MKTHWLILALLACDAEDLGVQVPRGGPDALAAPRDPDRCPAELYPRLLDWRSWVLRIQEDEPFTARRGHHDLTIG